ncbi:MAG: diguanylate cyclase domain-containing protein [Nocardioides sp.]
MTNRPFTVALVDLDHFKKFNDTYCDLKGDQEVGVRGPRLPR